MPGADYFNDARHLGSQALNEVAHRPQAFRAALMLRAQLRPVALRLPLKATEGKESAYDRAWPRLRARLWGSGV